MFFTPLTVQSNHMSAQVSLETEASFPLAVIFHGGHLGTELKRILEPQNIYVRHLVGHDDILSITDHPRYIYYFASDDFSPDQFLDTLLVGSRENTRFILILDNLSKTNEEILQATLAKSSCPVSKVTLTGRPPESAAPKLARLIFSPQREQDEPLVITGPLSGPPASAKPHLSTQEVLDRLDSLHRRSRRPKFSLPLPLLLFPILVFLLLTPFLWLLFLSLFGWQALLTSKEALLRGDYQAAQVAGQTARDRFVSAENLVQNLSPLTGIPFVGPGIEKANLVLSLSETVADSAVHFSNVAPGLAQVPNVILGNGSISSLGADINSLTLEASLIDLNLGFVEAELSPLLTPGTVRFLNFFGFPIASVDSYHSKISEIRSLLKKTSTILSVVPTIISDRGRRSYLIVFQNPTELRPTGGFIGSYAVVHTDGGKVLDYQINDIYTADGQLRGQIAPPDEILHFLGNPFWYMRDANFAPDFPLTAQRLEWFFQKETGQKVDGVFAIDLGAVQKILSATGPLPLPDYGETVSADNLFQKAESAAEINFFPGSNQKRDYLGAVAKAVLDKIIVNPQKDWLALGIALKNSLEQKNLLFYFNSPALENVFRANSWAGSLDLPDCRGLRKNCFMLVDSNFGANKANYFLTRQFQINSTLSKGGDVETTVKVSYTNNSPSESWPGGKYKNYFRFLIPSDSRVVRLDLGDGRTASLSTVLTAAVLSKVPSDQFFVFQNKELAMTDKNATTSAFLSVGALLEVPIQSSRTVSLTFRPQYKVDFSGKITNFAFKLIKQPGTGPDPVTFTLDYPSFLTPKDQNIAELVANPQQVVYNLDLSTDRDINIKLWKPAL